MKVSVVIPVYRNKETLNDLHHQLVDVFIHNNLPYELIFVNDACPENSLATLKNIAVGDDNVVVIPLKENEGQQRAVMHGLALASGVYTVIMDADLQDDPKVVPILLKEIQKGYSAVFAGRCGKYESEFRLFTSRIFKTTLHHLCGVPKDAGIFLVMTQELRKKILQFRVTYPFIVAMIGCSGLATRSIPIKRNRRIGGGSAYSPWKRFKTAIQAIAWVIGQKLTIE